MALPRVARHALSRYDTAHGLSCYIVAAAGTRQGCVIREAPDATHCCLVY
jgi:hypothetical protein